MAACREGWSQGIEQQGKTKQGVLRALDPNRQVPDPIGPEAVERYLRRHGLGARRSLSQNHLADGLVLERHLFVDSFATDDAAIGINSFIANGPGQADFTGR